MKISDIILENVKTVVEKTMKSAVKKPLGPKFSGYYGATQRGAPKPGQGFGGAAESVGVELDEVAPPDQESWIKKNKERFIKQYGKNKGTEILYATAWKRSKANESKINKLSWNNLPDHLLILEKIEIFEQYAIHENLIDGVEKNVKEQFELLFNMSDSLIKNKNYFVVPLILVNNKLMLLNSEIDYLKFINTDDGQLVFESDSTIKKYPHEVFRNKSIFNTFVFLNKTSYDKFRTIVNLKFDYSLPDIVVKNIEEVVNWGQHEGHVSKNSVGIPEEKINKDRYVKR